MKGNDTMIDDTVCTPFMYDTTLILWLTYTSENGTIWYVTSDVFRNEYQLWKGKKKTAKKSSSPLDLYQYIK